MDQMAHTEMVDYADNQEGTFSRLFLSQFWRQEWLIHYNITLYFADSPTVH